MRKAVGILGQADTAHKFEQFIEKVEKLAVEATAMDEAFGDIPDDLLGMSLVYLLGVVHLCSDPITCLIMDDPVQLPSSGHVMDRSTIARHLLSDERDPFSRAPLKIEQVVPRMCK